MSSPKRKIARAPKARPRASKVRTVIFAPVGVPVEGSFHTLFRRGAFDFKDLFIFEIANNHQGDVAHGLRIIDEIAKLTKEFGIRGAIKFQFRDLDSFIHPSHKKNTDNKHIPRFLSTKLAEEQFHRLIVAARERGLLIMATPFDEKSVGMAERLNVDILKVASCSALDWPLLERIVEANRPIVCSTAGVSVSDVDRIVSFFQHRGAQFSILHCVALYPTPAEKMNLIRIVHFIRRYPTVTIGYSTHENPESTSGVRIAYAQGARIFEKHVGIPTGAYKVNAYSATPEQVRAWLSAWQETRLMIGTDSGTAGSEEAKALRELMRGVYAKRPLRKGMAIGKGDVYFAMPSQEGQLVSGEWKEGMIADRAYKPHESVSEAIVSSYHIPKNEVIARYARVIKGLLSEAGIAVGSAPDVELSHHYGLDRFLEFGTTIINCINREYCKKILVQIPEQYHPAHYHKKKEEAFQILSGELIVELEGKRKVLYPGDVLVIPRGTWHSFWSDTGVIFEEISTTHFNDDSFYADKAVNRMPREGRKTELTNWGRHQFDEEKA